MIPYVYIPRERTTLHTVRNGFVFAPRYNKAGRRDGSYFTSRARRFCTHHGFADPLIFDNDGDDDGEDDHERIGARRREIYRAIDDAEDGIDAIAYFGHGSERSLLSAGIGPAAVPGLVDRFAQKCAKRVVVILYACRCGARGGIGSRMREEFRRNGVDAIVFAHQTSGDTAANPHKRRYPNGDYLVEPGTDRFLEWQAALRDTDLWMRYPFIEPALYL
jgi:hypothetical protein